MAGRGFVNELARRSRRQVTLKDGTEWTVQAIPPLLLERIYSNETGRPEPPVVDVKYGKKASKEVNRKDPDYLAALAAWEKKQRMTSMTATFVMGVVGEAPEDLKKEWVEYFPEYTEKDWKYFWIASRLATEDSITELAEAITGMSMPTEDGVNEAMETFQSPD